MIPKLPRMIPIRPKYYLPLKDVLIEVHKTLAVVLALWAVVSLGLLHWSLVPFLLGSLTGWIIGLPLVLLVWRFFLGPKGKGL